MVDDKSIEELRALLAKATPGPWEADNENNDGCYGLGDDCHEGFQSASIHAPDGRGGYIKLFDALNSDAACIEEEWDEDQHYAWDEVSRANAALIVAMRNALPTLLDLATASLASAGEDEGYDYVMAAETLCNGIQAWGSGTAFDKCREALQAAFEAGRDKASTRIRALTAENEAMRRERDEMALEDIYRVGDGYNEHRPEDGKYAGTTGEGHARCREIARRARSELEGR